MFQFYNVEDIPDLKTTLQSLSKQTEKFKKALHKLLNKLEGLIYYRDFINDLTLQVTVTGRADSLTAWQGTTSAQSNAINAGPWI